MIRVSLAILGLLFLNSCTSDPEPQVIPVPPQPLYTEVAGNIATTDDLKHLRYGENVKGYTIGRYVDPKDPNVMYEQNVIYRLEEQSSWNLQPNLPVSIPYEGTPRKLLYDDDRQLRAEIEVKAEEERKLYQYLLLSAEETKKNKSILQKVIGQSKELVELNKKQQDLIKQEADKNKQLSAENDALKKDLEKLIKYHELREQERLKNSRFRRN